MEDGRWTRDEGNQDIGELVNWGLGTVAGFEFRGRILSSV